MKTKSSHLNFSRIISIFSVITLVLPLAAWSSTTGHPDQDEAVAMYRQKFADAVVLTKNSSMDDLNLLNFKKRWECDTRVAVRNDFRTAMDKVLFRLDPPRKNEIENHALNRVRKLVLTDITLAGGWKQSSNCYFHVFVRADREDHLYFEIAGDSFAGGDSQNAVPSLVDDSLWVASYGECVLK